MISLESMTVLNGNVLLYIPMTFFVRFRDLLVCWHFPLFTWVGQGTPVMWYSQLPQPHSRFAQSVCKYHCLVTWALWCLQPNTWCIRSKSLFSWPTCMLAFSTSLSAPIRQQPAVHLTWVCQRPHVMWFSELPFQSSVHPYPGSLKVYVNTIVL